MINTNMVAYSMIIMITSLIAIHEELKDNTLYGVMLLSFANTGSVVYTELLDNT